METTSEERQYAMFIHLAQFAGYIIPGLGWILPLVLWLVRRENSAFIDENGKIVLNWILSCLVYGILAGILTLLLIGIPLLVALGVCSIVFIVLGAIRANEGIAWAYPLSIRFLS